MGERLFFSLRFSIFSQVSTMNMHSSCITKQNHSPCKLKAKKQTKKTYKGIQSSIPELSRVTVSPKEGGRALDKESGDVPGWAQASWVLGPNP